MSNSKPFNTTNGSKQRCRDLFITAVQEHIPNPLSFFTLPSQHAHDARMIRDNWPKATIRGVEKSRDIFDHILDNHHIIDPYNGTVGDYVKDHAGMFRRRKLRYFDAAFIDYTGTAKKADVMDVCEFAAHMTARQSVIALTFCKFVREPRTNAQVEDFVMTNAILDEIDYISVLFPDAKPFAINPPNAWNQSRYLADAIRNAIELGYQQKVSDEMMTLTTPIGHRLQRLNVLEAFTYKATNTSVPMHFILLYLERFK